MAETIVINAQTREIVVPDAERNFGVAGECRVERKHIRIEGRIVEGTDLASGFAWKVSCENGAKKPCADLIDSIVADADGIEFDWIVGAGPMAYKGDLKFSVCAKRVNALAEVLNEWHSQIGVGYVSAGLEATAEDIGGYDLAAQLQRLTAEAQQHSDTAAASAQKSTDSAAQAADSAADAKASAAEAQAAADKAAGLVADMPDDYAAALQGVGKLQEQMMLAYPDNGGVTDATWSAQHIVDMLCPAISEVGNPVQVWPVEGYPMGAVASWEPVQEGEGEPSPDNVRAIKGRDSVAVTRCGANLLDTDVDKLVQITWSGTARWAVMFTAPGDGVYTAKKFGNGYNYVGVIDNTLIRTLSAIAMQKGQILYLFTTSTSAKKNVTDDLAANPLMLVLGDEAPEEFVPYNGKTVTVELPETVYGGSVDAATGKGVKTWALITLDGTENFNAVSSAANLFLAWGAVPGNTGTLTSAESVCDRYMCGRVVAWNKMTNGMALISGDGLGICDARYETAEDFKAYLAAQYAAGTPVQIAYKLAEPANITATGAGALPALAGLNTLLSDADSLAVTGRADPIKRITDLEDATASMTTT